MLAVAVSGYVDEDSAVDAPLMPVQKVFADYLAGYVGSGCGHVGAVEAGR